MRAQTILLAVIVSGALASCTDGDALTFSSPLDDATVPTQNNRGNNVVGAGVSTTGQDCTSNGVSVTGTCGELIDYTQSDARQCWLQGGEFDQDARICIPTEQEPFYDNDRNGIEDYRNITLEDYIQRWYRGGRSIYDNIGFYFPDTEQPEVVTVSDETPAPVEPPAIIEPSDETLEPTGPVV